MSAAVRLYSPMPLDSGKGNAVSALRIAGLLQAAGMAAEAIDHAPAADTAALVVFNAWRSGKLALEFHRAHPERPLLAVLTGTDIYPEFGAHAVVPEVLAAAHAVVVWHPEALDQLPAAFREKAVVIPKSVPELPAEPPARRTLPAPPAPVEVLVIGHLREVKDPFRTADAAWLLPKSSRIHITHAGQALSEDMAAQARDLMQQCPRYEWVGGLPRAGVLHRLRTAALTVNSSFAEGGANAVVESLRCGVPVLASRIPGNTGILGRDWPGLFTAGDTGGLALLLQRCEEEPAFYDDLAQRTVRLAESLVPAREQITWVALLQSLLAA